MRFAAAVLACVALLVCCFLGGAWTGARLKQGEWDAAVVNEKAGKDAALRAAAAAIARIEVKSETHIQPLRTEIRDNPVYRDCAHSPDGLRHLNALIEGDAGDGGVPEGDAPR